jgi:hypothetical protein
MAETPPLPLRSPSGGAGPGPAGAASIWRPAPGAVLALAAVLAGNLLLGLAGGLAWEHLAPRALFVVVSTGAASVVNPETSAFIAADGWYCVVAVASGLLAGLLGYVLAVRRYGPLPMIGVLGGGLAAALVALWVGQRSGVPRFDARLHAARSGTLLRAPITLGSHGALALWPLAAGVIAGAIEAAALLRERRQALARPGR